VLDSRKLSLARGYGAMLRRIVPSAVMITAATHSAGLKKHDVAYMCFSTGTRLGASTGIIPWFANLRAAAGVGSGSKTLKGRLLRCGLGALLARRRRCLLRRCPVLHRGGWDLKRALHWEVFSIDAAKG